jgi:hypothetical protein
MSEKYKLDLTDMKKLGKNAALVGIAAAIAYLGQNVIHVDLGAASVILVPIISTMFDAVVKWAKDNTVG